MLAVAFLFALYFSAYLINAYATFHEYGDLGNYEYSVYFNLHYPQIAHGLQMLVIGNHISLLMVLLYPLSYIFPSALTLLFVQLCLLTLAGIAIFFTAEYMLGDSLLAFVLSLAFFIYPGTIGQMVFDAHFESAITVFYVLVFYFYARGDMKLYTLSLLFLFATIESATVLGISFGLAMLLYEWWYVGGGDIRAVSGEKLRFIGMCLLLSIVMTALYGLVIQSLANAYANGEYPGLPGFLYITSGSQGGAISMVKDFLSNPIGHVAGVLVGYSKGFVSYITYGVLLVFLGFGISAFFDFFVSLMLVLPWLGGIFVLDYGSFAIPFSQYYGFVIGPILCGVILGINESKRRGNRLAQAMHRLGLNAKNVILIAAVVLPVLLSIAAPLVYLFVLSPLTKFHEVNAQNLGQFLLFQTNSSEELAYAQLNGVIAKLPPNASIISYANVWPHIANREYAYLFTNYTYFSPEFVLLDTSAYISGGSLCVIADCAAMNSTLAHNYTVYAVNGTAILYKKVR